MATVLEGHTTEEQRFVVLFFLWANDSMQRIFTKKCFLFTIESVCRVNRFTTGWQMFRWWRRGWNGFAEVSETTVKRPLSCGFRHIDKTIGQICHCWWRICEHIKVFFPISNITCFTFYIHLWHIYWLPVVTIVTSYTIGKYFRCARRKIFGTSATRTVTAINFRRSYGIPPGNNNVQTFLTILKHYIKFLRQLQNMK
jgi:hypothetical protein